MKEEWKIRLGSFVTNKLILLVMCLVSGPERFNPQNKLSIIDSWVYSLEGKFFQRQTVRHIYKERQSCALPETGEKPDQLCSSGGV